MSTRVAIPGHGISFDPGTVWVADPFVAETKAHGGYFRSVEHGVYLNVRAQPATNHPHTERGLRALLAEQGWASEPKDAWTDVDGALTIVGATFETVGMGGEVVLEIFVTDGDAIANLAGPGTRDVIAKLIPSARALASTIRFGEPTAR